MSEKIEYKVIRKNIKNVYIRIKDKEVIVIAPKRVSETKIDEFITQKSNWINKKLNSNVENRNVDVQNKKYVYILGEKIPIIFEYKNIKNIKVELTEKSCIVFLPNDLNVINKEVYENINDKIDNKLKELAKEYILVSMQKYMALTKLKPDKIVIRKFKSIWGNCSSSRVIKINQNLVHYGIEQIEYVCLHELTHLKYMNHQREFWGYVEKYMPNYKKISKVLKQ